MSYFAYFFTTDPNWSAERLVSADAPQPLADVYQIVDKNGIFVSYMIGLDENDTRLPTNDSWGINKQIYAFYEDEDLIVNGDHTYQLTNMDRIERPFVTAIIAGIYFLDRAPDLRIIYCPGSNMVPLPVYKVDPFSPAISLHFNTNDTNFENQLTCVEIYKLADTVGDVIEAIDSYSETCLFIRELIVGSTHDKNIGTIGEVVPFPSMLRMTKRFYVGKKYNIDEMKCAFPKSWIHPIESGKLFYADLNDSAVEYTLDTGKLTAFERLAKHYCKNTDGEARIILQDVVDTVHKYRSIEQLKLIDSDKPARLALNEVLAELSNNIAPGAVFINSDYKASFDYGGFRAYLIKNSMLI